MLSAARSIVVTGQLRLFPCYIILVAYSIGSTAAAALPAGYRSISHCGKVESFFVRVNETPRLAYYTYI